MKSTVFKDWYKTAAAENIDKQHAKMCQLLELQHRKVVDVEGEKWFQLQNGLRIKSV